jgi:dATP pyrophosphohydrolase
MTDREFHAQESGRSSVSLPDATGDCLGVIIHVLRGRGSGGHFLFMERSGGRYAGEWWPVAGTCEAGEDPVWTAVRELEEETALVPDAIYTTGRAMDHPEEPGHLQLFLAFVASDAEVKLNHEHSDHVWLDVEETIEFVPDSMEVSIRDLERRFMSREPLDGWLLWSRERAD